MQIEYRKELGQTLLVEPAATTHPMSGGRAPEIAPISMAKGDFFLRGVYIAR